MAVCDSACGVRLSARVQRRNEGAMSVAHSSPPTLRPFSCSPRCGLHSLEGNGIGDEGAAAIADALKSNGTLLKLE